VYNTFFSLIVSFDIILTDILYSQLYYKNKMLSHFRESANPIGSLLNYPSSLYLNLSDIVKEKLIGGAVNPSAPKRIGEICRMRTKKKNKDLFQPLGSRWEIPGDGLCALHSLFCFIRRFNYIFLVSHYVHNNKLSDLRKFFIIPEIKKWMQEKEWKKIIPEDDRRALENYSMLESGVEILPKALDIIPLKKFFCCYYNIPDITILNGEDSVKVANFVNNKDSMENQKIIYYYNEHFEYATMVSNLQSDNEVKRNLAIGWDKLVPPNEKDRLDELMKSWTGIAEDIKKDIGLKRKLEDLKQKNKLEADNFKDLIKEQTDLVQKMTNPVKSNEPIKEKFAPRTSLVFKDNKTTGFYSHNFELGKEFSKIIENIGIRLFEKPHKYCHPGQRILADYCNFEMIKNSNLCENKVLEHAAKYAKTLAWTNKNVNYDFTRPVVIKGTDDAYRIANPLNDTSKNHPSLNMKCFEAIMTNPDSIHIFTDVIYYPGVLEGITDAHRMVNKNIKGKFSCANYPKREGKYYYYDNEGYFIIKGDTIDNQPLMNGKGYQHDLICLPSSNFSLLINGVYINATLAFTARTSKDSSYSYWNFETSSSPIYHLIEAFVKSVDNHYPVINRKALIHNDQNSSSITYITQDKLCYSTRYILPNWDIQYYLDEKMTFKSNNKTSNIDQVNYLYKKYKEEREEVNVRQKISSEDFNENAALWLYTQSVIRKRLISCLDAPEFHDLHNNEMKFKGKTLWERIKDVFYSCYYYFRHFFNDPEYRSKIMQLKNYINVNYSGNNMNDESMIGGGNPSNIINPGLEWVNGQLMNTQTIQISGITVSSTSLQSDKIASLKSDDSPVTSRKIENAEVRKKKKEKRCKTDPVMKKKTLFQFNDFDDLEQIPERHFDQTVSKKFYHSVGNEYIEILRKGKEPVCTCEDHTYEKILNTETPIHFGHCQKNIDACIFARGFNTALSPEPETLYLFKNFVDNKWFKDNESKMAESILNLTDDDYSFEKFINDTDPSKRKIYINGFKEFLNKQKIDVNFELMSKTNEVHFDKLCDVRPRMIFNPSSSMKAVGAYLARIMIKIMKKVEHGFISGYSTNELSDKIMKLRNNKASFHDGNVYSYDGSSHDAHQSFELIDIVDHKLMKFMLPRILADSRCAVPNYLLPEVLSAIVRLSNKFFTKLKMRGVIHGTVFSGHPTLTTLFNTIRTTLYNRYAVFLLYPQYYDSHKIWAAGDDVLSWLPIKIDPRMFKLVLGGDAGSRGLGQNAKDFKVGELKTHTFLSKQFIYLNEKLNIVPIAQRLYKAGVSYSKKSALEKREHRLANYIAFLDLPRELKCYALRFLDGNIGSKLTPAMKKLLSYDWAYKLRLKNRTPDEDLEAPTLLETDRDYLLKVISERVDSVKAKYDKELKFDHEILYKSINDVKHVSYIGQISLDGLCANGSNLPGSYKLGPGFMINLNNNKRFVKNSVCGLNVYSAKFEKLKYMLPIQPYKGNPSKNKKKSKRSNKTKALQNDRTNKLESRIVGAMKNSSSKANNVSIIERGWLNKHHKDEISYALGLFEPTKKRCIRIPNPIPVATAVASQQGVLTLTANATGFFACYLAPFSPTGIVAYNSAAGFNESSSQTAAVVSIVNSIMVASNAARLRVVSAWMGITDLTNSLTKTGTITYGMMPASQLTGTADTIRDSMWTKTISSASASTYVGGFYLPMDTNGMTFASPGATPADYMTPVVFVSGCTASANISVQYFINYEYIPAAGQSDLLSVGLGPVGSAEQSLVNVGQIQTSGGGFAASLGNFASWAINALPSFYSTAKEVTNYALATL